MINSCFIRFALAVILFMHSFFSIFTGDVNHFGRDFLDQSGFSPLGVYLAWLIKLSHLISVPFLLLNKFLKPIAIVNIIIFLMGIVIIHWHEGWFVVGGGRNGVEFNFLLIFCFLSFFFPKHVDKSSL